MPCDFMTQEAHLPVDRLTQARALVHLLLPAYSPFAGRPQRGPDRQTQSQVVTRCESRTSTWRRGRPSWMSERRKTLRSSKQGPRGLP